jgi:hypothetical protein
MSSCFEFSVSGTGSSTTLVMVTRELLKIFIHHQPINVPTAGHNPPHVLSADWWVLNNKNTAGTNDLSLPKLGGARDIKFFGHPSDDQPTLLNFRDLMTSVLTTGHQAPYSLIEVINL